MISGLSVGTHTVTAVTTAGRTIVGTITVNANCSVTISANLRGVPLSSISIVLGATTTPAQTPSQLPSRGAPGQVPVQLPHTGAGGAAL
ncbi:MAG: hypothetical protein ACR2JY_19195 [Chloroflexota bacterium]